MSVGLTVGMCAVFAGGMLIGSGTYKRTSPFSPKTLERFGTWVAIIGSILVAWS